MEPTLHRSFFIALSAAGLAASCTPSLEEPVKPYEDALGPGWTCHLTPDEFKRAGVVVEKTTNGNYFFHQEISEKYERLTGGFGLPTLNYSYTFSFSGLENFLKGLGIEIGSISIDAGVNETYTAKTTYGGASKTALTGSAAAAANEDLAAELASSSSTFYLIREAVAVQSADVQINRAQNVQIGANQANNQQSLNSNTANVSKDFERPLGICTISQEITKTLVVESTESSGLPAEAVIQRKP